MIGNGGGSSQPREYAAIYKSKVFSISKRFTAPSGGSSPVDIIVDPTGVSGDKQLIFLPLAFKAIGGGPVTIDIYFGGDIDDDGDVWDAMDRNTPAAVVPETVVRFGATVNTTGAKLPIEFMIASDGVAAVATIGGDTKDDLPFISRKDGKYLIRLNNIDSTDALCAFSASFFEI
jgi:hypothetical protein